MKFFLLLIIFLLLFNANPALAEEVSSKDIQVIKNSLKYIRGLERNEGSKFIIAIYDSSSPNSKKESENFVKKFNNYSKANNGRLRARLIEIKSLNNTEASVAYVPKGLTKNYQEIFQSLKQQRIFPLSKDTSCTKAKICILSIQTTLGVDIYLSEKALRSLGFEVNSAFKFMVKRI